jgi:fumarate reductase flavoprotein subunit
VTDFDVVVIGSGAAGLVAALTASSEARSVLLVESESSLGGSSALSGGLIIGAGSQVQRASGIEDTAQNLAQEYLAFNQFGIERGLARAFAAGSGAAVDWLVGLGVAYEPELIADGACARPRIHRPIGHGAAVIDVLVSHVRADPLIDVALGHRVDRLLVSDGRVVGVAANGETVGARSVIVASGGFGAAPALWPEHLPSLNSPGRHSPWYIGAPGARGDAFRFAAQVDADVVGHDRALVLPGAGLVPREMDLEFPPWLLVVDRAGSRRFDESGDMSEQQAAFAVHRTLFAVFDDRARLRADGRTATNPRRRLANWTLDAIDAGIKSGAVRRADSIEGLASQLSIDVAGLTSTVLRYNRFVDEGSDPEFGKDMRGAARVVSAPFYGLDLAPTMLCVTSKGLRVDHAARVLTRSGEPVPGLYAAGECCGGVVGPIYFSSGNSWTECVVFGRLAGHSASVEVRAARPR